MTEIDDSDRDRSRDEVLAAEYAVGVLSFADRKRLEARIEREPAFALLVAQWEDRLSPLELPTEEAPPRSVYPKIEARLFGSSASAGARRGGWWHSVAVWRGVAFASMAAVVVLAAMQQGLFGAKPSPAPAPLVAAMKGEGSPLALLASYDAASGRLAITPVAADADAPRSLELWLVPGGDAAPVALGVLPQDGRGVIDIAPAHRANLSEGITLAVSVEPPGGSPTGLPTGPVIAAGEAHHP
ncbi:anti-sigma-K factor RskA [Rhizobium sp. PP-F2F-G48]|uniref:anti-sigma factor n=1 Tax=Rhizobium sp. PP-F2F-G48 TaxID=2135651 RepID=UPI00104F742A|nr:anti-sigma factor [Rhizobium sp. PP-F2F-G48]TCM58539.1 anti-sigma-K factor RskA [Rhizobium sp. PP-F2F-G48]